MKFASVANSKRHINLIPWGAETPQGTNVGLSILSLLQGGPKVLLLPYKINTTPNVW